MRGTNRGALRNIGSTYEEHTHTRLFPKWGRGRRTKFHMSEWFSAPTLVHSHSSEALIHPCLLYSSALHWARASIAEGCAQSWRTQSAWTRMAPEGGGGWGSHCWCVWLQCIRSGLKPWLGPGLTQAKPRPTQGPSLVNRARAVVDKGSAQEWRTGSDPTQNSTWRWWRPSTASLSLVEMRQCLGRLEGLLWLGLSQSTLDPNQVPVSTSYSSISPFWGWGAGAADEGGGQYTLGWKKASSDPTLRLLLQ